MNANMAGRRPSPTGMTNRLWALSLVVGAALVLGGCGSDTSNSTDDGVAAKETRHNDAASPETTSQGGSRCSEADFSAAISFLQIDRDRVVGGGFPPESAQFGCTASYEISEAVNAGWVEPEVRPKAFGFSFEPTPSSKRVDYFMGRTDLIDREILKSSGGIDVYYSPGRGQLGLPGVYGTRCWTSAILQNGSLVLVELQSLHKDTEADVCAPAAQVIFDVAAQR